ncbi:anhydro-N-acetylmuramic acid kinase [Bizionia myxarmorum]|uniref:Anhydro-N-acetylmuramic acid kinase n=2 Tax=Bizionia myxarmorum TaxID=291186 RepID=A0A5D0REJ4_9FLAO|nr:anhydro-N-acetylmuramic acid kinase [Bizionia myxarmorum]
MMNSTYKILGVMSGTSLDGVDLAYINLSYDGKWHYKFLACETIAYSMDWLIKLKNLVGVSSLELNQIDEDYTQYLGGIINTFLKKHHISELDFISSHGHTALHQPENGITVQIGNKKELAVLTNHDVICDFRLQDVQFGGQGAPLVPIGDKLLFPEFNYCVNLGGFANISTEIAGKRIAYDICPANIVLNHYVATLGLEYDDAGKIAASGNCDTNLLEELNNLEFYKKPYPKSLGLEWVEQYIFPCIDAFNLATPDILKTFSIHVAIQIGNQINKGKTLITGGGAYNVFVMEQIKEQTSTEITIPDNSLIEYKEALIFSLLGALKFRNEVNCLASVTGAKIDHSSGKMYHP